MNTTTDNADELQSNYADLFRALKKLEQYEAQQEESRKLWGMAPSKPNLEEISSELAQNYMASVAIAQAKLVHVDLKARGVDPDLAKLLVLVLLLLDGVDMPYLKDEIFQACAAVLPTAEPTEARAAVHELMAVNRFNFDVAPLLACINEPNNNSSSRTH